MLMSSLGWSLKAQQDPMYTSYMFNTMSINPAYAGSKGYMTLTGLSRIQWVGINGAPRTQSIIAHTPVYKYSLGLGLSVVNDRIGPLNNTTITTDYSYTLKAGENLRLALGLKLGFDLFSNNTSSLSKTDNQDAYLNTNLDNLFLPNVGAGAYLYNQSWYAGLSVPKLIDNKISETGVVGGSREKHHFYFIGGAIMPLNHLWKFKPSTLVKMVANAPVSFDISACFLYNEKVWAGLAYRNGDSFSGIFEINLTKQLRVGYAYDMVVSSLHLNSYGSHEIMISYDFRFRNDKILSPRYF
jgi:type IX secretion system PorP/SprF family membrane protein